MLVILNEEGRIVTSVSRMDRRVKIFGGLTIVAIISRGVLPSNTADFLILLGTIMATWKLLAGRRIHRNIRFVVSWIGLYTIIGLIGLFNSVELKAAVISMAYYAIGLGIFILLKWLIVNRKSMFDFMQLYVFIVSSISLPTLVSGLLFYVTGRRSPLLYIRGSAARGAGLYGNPNYYSIGVLVAVGFAMAVIRNGEESRFCKLNRHLLVLLALDVVFSLSRGAWLSLAVMLLAYLLSSLRKTKVNTRMIAFLWIIVVTLLFLFLICGPVLHDLVSGTFAQFQHVVMRRLADMQRGSGSGRYQIWREGFQSFSRNWTTFLFGLGGNQNMYYSSTYNATHNSYLKALYENGILGLSLIFLLIMHALRRSFRFKTIQIRS
ncbi:MAG: hypothetical protein GX957_08125, partial [Clostridiaceae bacterium]|nr:hypothetical protein [Clostridiaceae bacterium]